MVTVTTAENDGQSGRAVRARADVYVCDCEKLFDGIHYHMCIVKHMSLKVAISCSFSTRDKVLEAQ